MSRVRLSPWLIALAALSLLLGESAYLWAGLCCVLVHEWGHALCARALGLAVEGMEIAPFGGVVYVRGVEQLGTLMQFVSDAVRREVATSGSELIAQAVAYTQSNYADKDLSLESLCALFQISQTQFSLLFKREMGTSFLQYLLDQRIAAAQKLLRETSMKIYQIAEETGFGDASYFSYCFKQRCGLSPKEYRMQGGA